MECLDKLGNRIEVGSYIAYGHLLSRSAGLRIGKVTNIKYTDKDSYGLTLGKYDSHWRITVQGVDDDWHFQQKQLCAKKGTLLFPSRVIVLDKLTSDYSKLLG